MQDRLTGFDGQSSEQGALCDGARTGQDDHRFLAIRSRTSPASLLGRISPVSFMFSRDALITRIDDCYWEDFRMVPGKIEGPRAIQGQPIQRLMVHGPVTLSASNGTFLHRDDLTRRLITATTGISDGTTPMAAIDRHTAIIAPCSRRTPLLRRGNSLFYAGTALCAEGRLDNRALRPQARCGTCDWLTKHAQPTNVNS